MEKPTDLQIRRAREPERKGWVEPLVALLMALTTLGTTWCSYQPDEPFALGLLLLMFGTTLFLPVALPLLVKGVQVNPWKIARFLTLLMILPLIAGLTVNASSTSIAPRLRPVLEQVSTIALLAAFLLILALNFQGCCVSLARARSLASTATEFKAIKLI